jgi:hypothetical protein
MTTPSNDGVAAIDVRVPDKEAKAFLRSLQQATSRKIPPKRRKRRSGFEVQYVRVPTRALERLHKVGASRHVYRLAYVILREAFKLEQMAIKEIVLSQRVTEMPPKALTQAIATLVKLRMIRVKRTTWNAAARVIDVLF